MIWAIGDLHFDHTKTKPMDVFGDNWEGHEEKIIEDWKNKVKQDDLVLIPGDISWALKLDQAIPDLALIDGLPGIKCMIKGNHDYWWGTKAKLEALGFDTIHFIYNDSFVYEDYLICGTRAWYSKDSEDFDEKDQRVYLREINRLKQSMASGQQDLKKIIMLHYPPYDYDSRPNEFLELVEGQNVTDLIYGHLHGPGHEFIIEEGYKGTRIHCVSSDYLDFKLKRII